MDVIETGDEMVFSVSSVSGERYGKRYRVDLLENDGAGWCSCKDFATRRSPALKAGAPILTRQTSCKHLRQALYYFVTHLLPAMAKKRKRRE